MDFIPFIVEKERRIPSQKLQMVSDNVSAKPSLSSNFYVLI